MERLFPPRRTRAGLLALGAALAADRGGPRCALRRPRQAGADPPGEYGTVKVDGEEFDDHPDNEPPGSSTSTTY
jgi:hypothetical protein